VYSVFEEVIVINYSFPAVKGLQSRSEYYIAMVPIKLLGKLFVDEQEHVDPEFRAQRQLNEKRLPDMKRYILLNLDNYVFSAISASIDGEFEFITSNKDANIGVLEISMDATLLINDGQHRKAALLMAFSECNELGDETISVVFYGDQGLVRSQQIFTDLNKHAVKVPNSIAELYDTRNEIAVVTREVLNGVPFLNKYTNKEKDILGKYSSCLFTLSTICNANRTILKRCTDVSEQKEFLISYWNSVVENITLWKELENREISKIELRNKYIICQAIVIKAFGYLGKHFFENNSEEFDKQLIKLTEIDWSRNGAHWQLRNINENGKIIVNNSSIVLTNNYIKMVLGIPLTKDEEEKERKYTIKWNINYDKLR